MSSVVGLAAIHRKTAISGGRPLPEVTADHGNRMTALLTVDHGRSHRLAPN